MAISHEVTGQTQSVVYQNEQEGRTDCLRAFSEPHNARAAPHQQQQEAHLFQSIHSVNDISDIELVK